MASDEISEINIRPKVTILSVLQHLNYKPWFALAEFVDNAIQSYVTRKAEIEALTRAPSRLEVAVEVESGPDSRIVIRDNAGGIAKADYSRAFRPAELPPDRSALSEFGMGMKSAACWFAPEWTVRSKALGETVERTVLFNIDQIVHDGAENLPVLTRPAPASRHYTEITLLRPRLALHGRTMGKVREHLADIYRQFLRENILTLVVGGVEVSPSPLAPLTAATYTGDHQPDGQPKTWLKRVELNLPGGARVSGFAGLLAEGDTEHAGFSLFRRKRLIQGSSDEKWRPRDVFGAPNDYVYQRLFGELEIEGVNVSHTKDGFRWSGAEEDLVLALRPVLDAEPLPLIRQARNFRARRSKANVSAKAENATKSTATILEKRAPEVLGALVQATAAAHPPVALPPAHQLARRSFTLAFSGRQWNVELELVDDPALGDWVSLSGSSAERGRKARLDNLALRLNLAHPFSERYVGAGHEFLEPLIRIAAAVGLAERAAHDSGAGPGGVRINFNRLLREALASN